MRIDKQKKLRSPSELVHADFELVARRLADDLAFGSDTSMFVGSGLEYAQSRPYEPGDSVRQLDWRLTAKTGKAFVKQYETLKRIAMYIVIDTSSSMSVASTTISKHDMAIWIASALGLVGQRRLSPVAIVGGGERETRLEPSLSQGDLWRALEPLRLQARAESTLLGDRIRSLEPRLVWTVPADGRYAVEVGDLTQRAGAEFFYRLQVRPVRSVMTAVAASHAVTVVPGKSADFKVVVTRRPGFTAPLKVVALGLPVGVTAAEVDVPEAGGEVTLVLTAGNDAATASTPIRRVCEWSM